VPRRSGVSPFAGTALDVTLRNLGVRTVVATGVSVNLAILGLAIEAVNLGYRVVVATDAVAGTPVDYADAVLDGTIALLAARLTVDQIAAVWSG
jgi:nicotinamidase-related amidase